MWNTYYAKELNSVLHLPDAVRVRVSLYDKEQRFLLNHMLWRNQTDFSDIYKNVKSFGKHTVEGDYFDIVFQYRTFVFKMEFGAWGDSFILKVLPVSGDGSGLNFVVTASVLWGGNYTLEKEESRLTVDTGEGSYRIQVYGKTEKGFPVNTDLSGIVTAAEEILVVCNLDEKISGIQELLGKKAEEAKEKLPVYGGRLVSLSDAIQKAQIWNTIYDPVKRRICAPVSRAWCVQNGKSFGSYVLFEWDTFFSALMFGTFDKEMAYAQVNAVFQEMTKDGMIPNFGSERGGSPDRSQPPVGSYCMLKLYCQFQDRKLLEDYYERLCCWNHWWIENRDGNDDGLLEWGSNPNPDGYSRGYFDEGNTMLCAMYESGLDNSPMYDQVKFNEETHTMELADVGLNALYALDCMCMGRIAGILDRKEDEKTFYGEYERIKEKMNREMYDEETGMYCNLHWNGEKDYRFSPTHFYPLLAQIPDERQAEKMVYGHLLSEQEFWGEYVIPSISKREAAYKDQDYWRGRIWGPMNYLVYEGLKQYPFEEVADKFSKKCRNLFLGEWISESHIHENYNAETGDGDDKTNADPFYTWGALLAYIPVCQGIYVWADGRIQFGGLWGADLYIENFPIGQDFYTLDTRERFILKKNGQVFIEKEEKNSRVTARIEAGRLEWRMER